MSKLRLIGFKSAAGSYYLGEFHDLATQKSIYISREAIDKFADPINRASVC